MAIPEFLDASIRRNMMEIAGPEAKERIIMRD